MNSTITETQLRDLIQKGCEFTKYKPDSPVAVWSKVDLSMNSYMGMKLFLTNGDVVQSFKLRGVKHPDGAIFPIQVVRG